jgi:hypothetical protein
VHLFSLTLRGRIPRPGYPANPRAVGEPLNRARLNRGMEPEPTTRNHLYAASWGGRQFPHTAARLDPSALAIGRPAPLCHSVTEVAGAAAVGTKARKALGGALQGSGNKPSCTRAE